MPNKGHTVPKLFGTRGTSVWDQQMRMADAKKCTKKKPKPKKK